MENCCESCKNGECERKGCDPIDMGCDPIDMEMKNSIHEYIRDNNNRKIGVMLSTVINGTVCFGWSLANKLDEFDKDIGMFIASDRAYLNLYNRYDKYFDIIDKESESGFEFIDDILPHAVKDKLPSFIDRMSRYYKHNEYSYLVGYLMSRFLDLA